MSGLRSAVAEALTSIVRQPVRTLLCALGTVVAVGAFTTTNGLTESASNAVSSSFNELRATTVEFQGPSTLSDADVARLARLRGVTGAGLVWDLDQQQPLPVTVGPSTSGHVADAAVGHGDGAVGVCGGRGGAVLRPVL